MMGVADELRTLAGAWDEWGLGGKLTELAERLETQEVADATSVLAVVAEMERHISGVEWMQDSPVARWARELREVVAGKTEAEEDARAAKWVREHGGLNSVSTSFDWHSLTTKRLYRMAFPEECDCEFVAVDDCFAELERRLMPPGMEWPCFENGAKVENDSLVVGKDGKEHKAAWFAIFKEGFDIYCPHGEHPIISAKYGERVKRPKPVPVGLDGLPIKKGDSVLAKVGGKLVEFTVLDIDPERFCGNGYILCGYVDKLESHLFAPHQLTHTKPEPIDSWEQWREDASFPACDYFARVCGAHDCGDCPADRHHDCELDKARDLERRAKALAEREMGE